ncbi:MAG: PEP-CTERM sorting domain-containing protein [Bryobacteraceae bacterium]
MTPPASPPAQWISYGPTGYTQSLFQPSSSTNPAVTIWADADGTSPTFVATSSNVLTLTVYADDTAGVFLYDNTTSTLTELEAPLLTTGTTCSGGIIGCGVGEDFTGSWSLPAGSYTLYFTDYQLGTGLNTTDNPMGLLFWGGDTTTPEPGALLLVGGGLLALGGLLRRKRVRQ